MKPTDTSKDTLFQLLWVERRKKLSAYHCSGLGWHAPKLEIM